MNISIINTKGHSVSASTNTFVIPKVDFYKKIVVIQNIIVSASQPMSNFTTLNINKTQSLSVTVTQ